MIWWKIFISNWTLFIFCDVGKYQYWHKKIMDDCIHFLAKMCWKWNFSSFFYMHASKILFFSSIPFSNKIYFFKSHILSDSYSTNVVVLNWILQFEFWMYSSQRPVNVQLSVIKIDKQFFTQNSHFEKKIKNDDFRLSYRVYQLHFRILAYYTYR